MRLSIRLINEDTTYNERLCRYVNQYMAEDFYIFCGEEEKAHITLISEDLFREGEMGGYSFPVLLCGVDGVERIGGRPAVHRYQPADELLYAVRRIYLEQNRYETASRGAGECRTALFLSPAGGVGTSTLALSMAIHAAQTGSRVIFLDLTQFSGLGSMIRPVEQSLSEVIFSLKMKKNLQLRLSEQLREDVSGFRYFGITERLQDMSELTPEDIRLLVSTLKESGLCDLLVIDADCRLDAACTVLKRSADQIYLVTNGREPSDQKLSRYVSAMQQDEQDLLDRCSLVYNGVDGRTRAEAQIPMLKELGRFPRVREASPREIAEQFSMSELWNHRLSEVWI